MAYDIEMWDGSEITVSLDGLPAGVFTMVMNVSDVAGNTATDEVIVDGVNFLLSNIKLDLVVWASTLTVVIFIAIVIVVRKMA
jgi:hypothetical protein